MDGWKWILCICLVVGPTLATSDASAERGDRGGEALSTVHGVDVEQSAWTEERRALDRKVEAFLSHAGVLDDAMSDGPAQMAEAAEEHAQLQQALEQRIDDHIDRGDEDGEKVAWRGFRMAQTYLNFGCEMAAMRTPEGLDDAQKQVYRQSLIELAKPLIVQANEGFGTVKRGEEGPWSEEAAAVVTALSEVSEFGGQSGNVERACDSTVGVWRADMDVGEREEILANLMEEVADKLEAEQDDSSDLGMRGSGGSDAGPEVLIGAGSRESKATRQHKMDNLHCRALLAIRECFGAE